MLTADLVRVRRRKGSLEPQYVDAENPDLAGLAETMVAIFRDCAGRPRQELDAELKDLLGSGTAFLLHRGLAKLLLDRCEFATDADVEPEELRAATFARAAAVYRDREKIHVDRDAIARDVAAALEIESAEFERTLYADLRSEQVLQRFRHCKPRWLLDRYNVALAQAVLLRASELQIEVEGQRPARYRELFRKLKFFRLLHRIERLPSGGYRIFVDGPLSLFRSSQKYGLQMAFFLPSLLHATRWRLTAEVCWGKDRYSAKFELDQDAGLRPTTRSTGQWLPEEVMWLEERFRGLDSEWDISTAGEIIDLGGRGVLTPEFTFTHRPTGFEVAMEVLGFWRRASAHSRLELLREHGPENLILAVSKELHVGDEEIADLPGEVYVFRSTPVARDVHKALERLRAGREG